MKRPTEEREPSPTGEPTGKQLLKLGLVCVLCLSLAAGVALIIQSLIS